MPLPNARDGADWDDEGQFHRPTADAFHALCSVLDPNCYA
jgi:hypothetical protein